MSAPGRLLLVLGLAGCPTPEGNARGVVPPMDPGMGPPRSDSLEGWPRALELAQPPVELLLPPAPPGPPAAGATRLQGTVDWSLADRDRVRIEVGLAQAHGPPLALGGTERTAPGAWWLDVPRREGRVVLSAWIDSGGNGPDVTDLAAPPIELDLARDAGVPVHLVLGTSP